MAQHVQLRRDTAAAWVAANSLLTIGEIGLETDTHKFKIGDGVTAWNSLGYASALPSGGTTGQALKKASNADYDLSWGSVATSISDITGLGTGVATALAVNVGTAGAAVVNGGALGTPSSGTLTNCSFPTLNQNTSGTAAGLSATLAIASGGTNITSYTAGDILYCSATNVLSKLPKGSDTQVLTLASGLPSWATPAASGATLGANIFTRLQTITQGTVNEGIIASTGFSLTGASAVSMVDLAGTLNTSGSPDVVALRVTNTATGASSRLLNLYAGSGGATSMFSVSMTGTLHLGAVGSGNAIINAPSSGGDCFFQSNASLVFRAGTFGCSVQGTQLGIGNFAVNLYGDVSNTLSIKNSTTAQTMRVYKSTTGPAYLELDTTGILMHSVGYAFTDGAAASSATLTNAPAAGNPTKWIPINDNGTTRYMPAW